MIYLANLCKIFIFFNISWYSLSVISLSIITLLKTSLKVFSSFLTFSKSLIHVWDFCNTSLFTLVLIAQTMVTRITIAVFGNIRVARLMLPKTAAVDVAPIDIPVVTAEDFLQP